jgi:uncharacterized membrane protein YdbT with pleckstrin-like domain
MGYINNHLITGEQVIYRARLHKIIFWKSVVCFAAGVAVLVFVPWEGKFFKYAGYGLMALALLWAGMVWLDYSTSEFGVTNKRVLMKRGLVRRRTLELFLNKIEAIGVNQTVLGRIIRAGSVEITGSGNTKEEFLNIARPMVFREQVHEQISTELDEKGDLGRDD